MKQCGMHVGQIAVSCRRCARARAATEAALADVVPVDRVSGRPPAGRARVSPEIEQRVIALRAEGHGWKAIERLVGVSDTTCKAIVIGRDSHGRVRPDAAAPRVGPSQSETQRAAHQRAMPIRGERAHRMGMALPPRLAG
jgi:hypothetical protein